MTREEEEELLRFADELQHVLHRAGEETELPVELEMRLRRMTREYQPDDSHAWVFLAGFTVVVVGLYGSAVWTSPILLAMGVLGGLGVVVDRTVKALGGWSPVQSAVDWARR